MYIDHGSADSTSYINNLCQAKAMPTNAKMEKQRTNQTRRKGSTLNINVHKTGGVTDHCRNNHTYSHPCILPSVLRTGSQTETQLWKETSINWPCHTPEDDTQKVQGQ